jgi:hypothetical protein
MSLRVPQKQHILFCDWLNNHFNCLHLSVHTFHVENQGPWIIHGESQLFIHWTEKNTILVQHQL